MKLFVQNNTIFVDYNIIIEITTIYYDPGGSRGNIGYRVVQQQSMMGLNDDDDENLNADESSDDERSGYPTLPVDGIGSRPSAGSLRHVSPLRTAFNNNNI